MEKFIAVFAIDGHTTNVQFEIAEKATVQRQQEDRQPRQMAATDACGTYNKPGEIIKVNKLEHMDCKEE